VNLIFAGGTWTAALGHYSHKFPSGNKVVSLWHFFTLRTTWLHREP